MSKNKTNNARETRATPNDLALAQPPRENAGDTPHAQVTPSAGTEREGVCCQQRLVLPVDGVLVSNSAFGILVSGMFITAGLINVGLTLLVEQLLKMI